MTYERKPLRYYAFDIVDVSRLTQDEPAERATLSLPASPESPFATPGSAAAAEHLASLPQIALPVLKFSDIGTVDLPDPASLTLDPRFEPRDTPPPQDAWARFGEEIQDLRDVLRNLPFLEGGDARQTNGGGEEPLRPAPGYKATIRWLGDPEDRRLLFTSPVDPQALAAATPPVAPVEILFRVQRDGRVTEVLPPVGEDGGIAAAVADALRRYRFEPVPGEGRGAQTGTFV